jgi:phosphatidylglycerophosphatase C
MDNKFFSNNIPKVIAPKLRGLALFDFDGTLTTKDTFIEFLKFLKGPRKFYWGILVLSPIIIFYKLSLIKNWKAKEILMKYFFGGMLEKEFQEHCTRFCAVRIGRIIKTDALMKLNFHKSNGDEIYIVSASPENWVSSYGDTISVKVIATQLEVKDKKMTGRILGKNCYGSEKTNRIHTLINLKDFSSIYAYGDSRGDREMLRLAQYPYYRRFY